MWVDGKGAVPEGLRPCLALLSCPFALILLPKERMFCHRGLTPGPRQHAVSRFSPGQERHHGNADNSVPGW